MVFQPNHLYKSIVESQVIQEVYSSTNLKPVKDIVETFLKVLNSEITIDDYVKIEDKYKIQLDTVDDISNDFLIKKATYNSDTDIVSIYLYSNTSQRLLESENLKNQFVKEVSSFLTHEDTHKQQYSKKRIKDKYQVFNSVEKDLDKVTDEKERQDIVDGLIKYARHYTEIDAYARQTGYLIRQDFPEDSVQEIFKHIKDKKFTDKRILNAIDFYTSPGFSNKESNKFFHTLYQYLNGDEQKENLIESFL